MAPDENRDRTFLERLSQTSRALRTRFDAELKAFDLTLARGRLLLHLVSARHTVGQAELSDVLEVEHPTTVRLLDGLEQSGLIERRAIPGDRRAKAIVLTAAGRRVGDRVLAMTDNLSERVLAGIDPADLAIAERVLAALSDNVARAAVEAAGQRLAS